MQINVDHVPTYQGAQHHQQLMKLVDASYKIIQSKTRSSLDEYYQKCIERDTEYHAEFNSWMKWYGNFFEIIFIFVYGRQRSPRPKYDDYIPKWERSYAAQAERQLSEVQSLQKIDLVW